MADEALREIEGLLEAQLRQVEETNKRGMMIGGAVVLLFGGYLFWAHAQISKLLDPEGLALAATGAALEAMPQASAALRSVVVDGAPDIAAGASTALVDMLPAYRQVLEDEMDPVIDEVTGILAQTTVQHMVAAAEERKASGKDLSETDKQLAMQQAADAVVERFDAMIEDAMDEPMENDGPTPRESIEASLEQLVTIDRGLRRVVRGQGDPQERELLLVWIDLISQYQTDANVAAAADHTQKENKADAKAAKAKAGEGAAGGGGEKAGKAKAKAAPEKGGKAKGG